MSRFFNLLVQNSFLAFVTRVVNQIGFVLLVFVISRRLGAEEVGIYTLAFRYTSVFLTIALWGLEGFLIREVSADPLKTQHFLVHSSLLRVVFGFVAYLILYFLISTVFDYPTEVRQIILLIALSLIPDIINRLFQAVFIAHQQYFYPAIISFLLSTARIVFGGWLIIYTGRLDLLAIFLVLTSLLGVPLSYFLFNLGRKRIFYMDRDEYSKESKSRPIKFNPSLIIRELAQSTPFALMELFVMIEIQADIFILSILLSEKQVGFYAAAQTIVSLLAFTHYGLSAGLYPMFTRLYTQDHESLWRIYKQLYRYIGLVFLPGAILLSAISRPLVNFIYPPEFDPSIIVVQWLIWSFILQLFDEPNSRLIVISGYQNIVTLFVALSMGANILLNFTLVPIFGIVGAAIAKLLSKLFFVTINGSFVYRRVSHVNPLPILTKLGVAALMMAAIVFAYPTITLWLRIIGGAVAFISISLLTGIFDAQEVIYIITRKWYCYFRHNK